MNIYFLGYLTGAYRSEGYIKSFLDNGIKHFYINNYHGKRRNLVKKIADIIMLVNSDIIFIPPLQHTNKLVKLAIFLRKRYIVDFYISYYDSNVFDYSKYQEGSKDAKKLKKLDINVLKNAELAIFLNESERDFYLERLELNREEINSTILPLYNPEKNTFSKLKFFKKERKIMKICWTGTYIPLHGLEKIIEAIAIFKDKYGANKIELVLWGDSDKKALPYMKIAKKLNLEKDVIFMNQYWGDLDKWNEYMSGNCDVSLGVFGDSNKSQTVLPNKVLDGIALKTPVLTQNSKGLTEFKLNKCIFTSDNSPLSIANKLNQIYNSKQNEIENNVNSAYQIYSDNFTYSSFNKRIEKYIIPHLKEGEYDE